MGHNLNSLKGKYLGDYIGDYYIIGVIRGDTRSLDDGPCEEKHIANVTLIPFCQSAPCCQEKGSCGQMVVSVQTAADRGVRIPTMWILLFFGDGRTGSKFPEIPTKACHETTGYMSREHSELMPHTFLCSFSMNPKP